MPSFLPGQQVSGFRTWHPACAAVDTGRRAPLLAALALLAAVTVERLDLYDQSGRYHGYVLIDEESRRGDVYDARARRLGFGQVSLARPGILDPLTAQGFRLLSSHRSH
jgi:hypothetical protein